MRLVEIMLTASCLATGALSASSTSSADHYQSSAEAALTKLQTWYNEDTGQWKSYTPSWWQSANQLTTLLDMVRLGSSEAAKIADTVVPNTFHRNGDHAFKNAYYDDEGWWAVAWMRAYEVTHNKDYLETAEGLFKDMTGGWGTNCSADGGLWWDKDHTDISPISNTLFIQVAAWLANRVPEDRKQYYADWAVKAWGIFRGSEMYWPEKHLVGGGIDIETCHTRETTWGYTYYDGTLISALCGLTVATGKEEYRDEAHLIAAAVMDTMSEDGELQEQHISQAHPGQAAPQWKGIFMRGLLHLHQQSPRPEYKAFAQKSADSILANDKNDEGALGPDWNGPFYGPANASPHSSAMDAVVAAWGASM
ncbi:Uu.00g117020.m01.CDS01 [Anthostomella pinea]|uniref:Uu.00g117020.m01.CDS01 n=1 Tax=Anthostomella pinea TaxID=933095 RepID=A0AAI8VG69_9PEZI|nr:Uu.00g117020.m01.CDS01 [Anthostomella pinea]